MLLQHFDIEENLVVQSGSSIQKKKKKPVMPVYYNLGHHQFMRQLSCAILFKQIQIWNVAGPQLGFSNLFKS